MKTIKARYVTMFQVIDIGGESLYPAYNNEPAAAYMAANYAPEGSSVLEVEVCVEGEGEG